MSLTSSIRSILVAGIGSPHGNDQAGWTAVEKLQEQFDTPEGASVSFIKLNTPIDLLELAVSGRQEQAQFWIIVDACLAGSPGTVHCWRWPALPVETFAKTSTHALGLIDTLQLAETLEVLAETVWVYGIEVDEHQRAIGRCLDQIALRIHQLLA